MRDVYKLLDDLKELAESYTDKATKESDDLEKLSLINRSAGISLATLHVIEHLKNEGFQP